jgi:hypothetical protein
MGRAAPEEAVGVAILALQTSDHSSLETKKQPHEVTYYSGSVMFKQQWTGCVVFSRNSPFFIR